MNNTMEFLRSFRVGGYAVFDFVASFLGIYLLAPFLTKMFSKIGVSIPLKNWIFLTIPIGFLFHIAFRQITPMTKDILDPSGHYIIKIIVITLLVLGLKGVHLIK